jgi:dihydrofolate reductase
VSGTRPAQGPLEPLVLVCAMAKNRVIGRGNKIPWDLPEDRKHFVQVTRGHAIIMGRATWDSLGRPLPKRRNIVVSRQKDLALQGAELAGNLEQALKLARETDAEPRLIGGGQLYEQALPLVTRIYLTVLDEDVPGDSFFPELDDAEWECSEERRGDRVVYRTLDRR